MTSQIQVCKSENGSIKCYMLQGLQLCSFVSEQVLQNMCMRCVAEGALSEKCYILSFLYARVVTIFCVLSNFGKRESEQELSSVLSVWVNVWNLLLSIIALWGFPIKFLHT